MTTASPLTIDEVLSIAEADGTKVYGDLSRFRIEMEPEDDGWHVNFFIKQPKDRNVRIAGGGPHYIIDANDGRIVSKTYYQ